MDDYLLFQLYGPLASWGDVAVGEERPSLPHPGKSAIVGLMAAALGVTRDQENVLEKMAHHYRVAVRVDSSGLLLRDYHTAQVPPQVALKKHPSATRKDELAALRRYQREHTGTSGTILSYREFRNDARYRIAVTAATDAPFSLDECAEALRRPRLPIYLGRKSCPPALPMQPQIATAGSILDAFIQAKFTDVKSLMSELETDRYTLPDPSSSLFWEHGMNSGVEPRETFTRYDLPRSRKRWQFAPRAEHHAAVREEE